jgi:peptidoglycan/xylan/chitin deacetylase (PgdA/CDA1 family)
MKKKILVLSILGLSLSNMAYANSNEAIVLMYHGISNKVNSTNTSLSNFQEQITYLEKNHFKIISTPTLVNDIKNKIEFPNKSIVITFDDGWKDQDEAMNFLAKNNIPATFCLVTWFQSFNSPTDLQKIDFSKYKNAPFTYINHSYTHDVHKFLVNPEQDTTKSEKVLDKLFGKYQPYYTYPYGEYNEKLLKVLHEHGYIAAYGVAGEPVVLNKVNIFNIPRYEITNHTSFEEFKKIVDKLNNSEKEKTLVAKK